MNAPHHQGAADIARSADATQDFREANNSSKPIAGERGQWGKAGCSDFCADVGQNLTPAQLKVLFFLTRYVNEKTGSAYMSPEALAYDTNMDRSDIRKHLARLVDLGVLRRTRGAPRLPRRWTYWLVDQFEHPMRVSPPHDEGLTPPSEATDVRRMSAKSADLEGADEGIDEGMDEGVTPSKLFKLFITDKLVEPASALRTPSASLRSADALKRVSLPSSAEQAARQIVDQAIRLFGAGDARNIVYKLVEQVGDQEAINAITAASTMTNPRSYIDAMLTASSSG